MDADALYQLPPEEFIAARERAAKSLKGQGDSAGAKALAGLRKPSFSAWLVNRLAAEQGDLLDSLLALGPALAEAQARGRAEDLRTLGAQRRQLVEAVTDTAASAAGRPVTAAVREEVAGTLEAALADPPSAEAVRSRRLVRALSYAGFGTVDLAGAVAARTGAGQEARSRPGGRTATPRRGQAAGPEVQRLEADQLEAERLEAERLEAVRTAEVAAHGAAGHLDDAVRASQKRTRRLAAASSALSAADTALRKARKALEQAEQERAAARAARERAQEEHDEALQAVQRAQDEAEAARSTLDRLRRG